MAVTPGTLWEQKEYIHGYEWQRLAFKLPFQLPLPSTSVGPENPGFVGKQAGRKTPLMFNPQPFVSAQKTVTE